MRKHLAIGLISATIIAYQLVVMQIFAYTQWHHFGFMVISVALLGFGVAGTYLSIYSRRIIHKTGTFISWIILLTGFLMTLSVPASQSELIRFDSLLVFTNANEKLKLTATYLVYFLPFFSGALAIGVYFIEQKKVIGKAYFINLIGSALGGILILFAMWQFKIEYLSYIITIFIFLAALLVIPKHKKKLYYSCIILGFIILIFFLIKPIHYKPSQFKNLTQAIELPGASIVEDKSSPYGTFHIIQSNLLRHAPGLSLNYHDLIPEMQAVYVNGNWAGAFGNQQHKDSNFHLRSSVFELPFKLISPEKILVLGAGEGTNLSLAINHDSSNITAVESNPFVISWLKESTETASVRNKQTNLEIYHSELRSFLISDTAHYDLIMFPVLGSFGGTSGVNAIQENYLLTVESIQESLHKLTDNGIAVFTTWIDYPSRYPLKLLATLTQSLYELNVKDPDQYIVAIKSWNTISFLLTKSAFIDNNKVIDFCEDMCFDLVFLPNYNLQTEECNSLQDTLFFMYLKKLSSKQNESFYNSYDFNVQPATDQQPFFHQFLKWGSLQKLKKAFGKNSLPFFEVGYYIVILTFLQALFIAFLLIILPLLLKRIRLKNRWNIILYFSGLGLGFMFLEIVFIHQFVLYFGNAIYATAAVISTMLLFSGTGSFFSKRIVKTHQHWLIVMGSVIILIILLLLFSLPLLQHTIGLSLILKICFSLLILAPVSFLLGIPFPTGISHLTKSDGSVAWAWGINGYLSVISVPLATIIAVEAGYMWVFMLAGMAYFFALLSVKR